MQRAATTIKTAVTSTTRNKAELLINELLSLLKLVCKSNNNLSSKQRKSKKQEKSAHLRVICAGKMWSGIFCCSPINL